MGWGHCFWLLFLGYVVWCQFMPCHFVSGSKGWLIFYHQSWCHEKSHSLWPNTLSSTVRKYFFHLSLCSSINKRETHQAQTSQYLNFPVPPRRYCALLQYLLTFPSHTDSLWLSLIFPLFLSVDAHLKSPLQSWLAMPVPIFEVFYPLSGIVRVHAGISISTMKLCMNTQCRDFLLPRNFITANWGGVKKMPSPVIFSHWNVAT